MCAFQGRGDVFDVEEEESGLRGVGLDCFGGELRGFDFVAVFLADGAFYFFLRDGNGDGMRVGMGIAEAAEDIFGSDGRELGAAGRGQCDLHVGDGEGLVAVIGDDEKDGEESVLVKVHGEYFCLVGSVEGVGGDGDFVGGVVVVGGIGFGGMRDGLYEVLGG